MTTIDRIQLERLKALRQEAAMWRLQAAQMQQSPESPFVLAKAIERENALEWAIQWIEMFSAEQKQEQPR